MCACLITIIHQKHSASHQWDCSRGHRLGSSCKLECSHDLIVETQVTSGGGGADCWWCVELQTKVKRKLRKVLQSRSRPLPNLLSTFTSLLQSFDILVCPLPGRIILLRSMMMCSSQVTVTCTPLGWSPKLAELPKCRWIENVLQGSPLCALKILTLPLTNMSKSNNVIS